MVDSPHTDFPLTRRQALKAGTVGITGFTLAGTGQVVSANKRDGNGYDNPIQVENGKSGDDYWSYTRVIESQAPQHRIEGYASETSVDPGGTLKLHVSTSPPETYKIWIHRLGSYSGDGGRRVATLDERDGQAQPIPEPDSDTGMNDAGWDVTTTFDVPDDWVSGVYIVQFILTSGPYSGDSTWYPVIVRASDKREYPADILIKMPSSTWQAYNDWGGKSLYTFNSTNNEDADIVSYNRPLHNPLYPHFDDGGPMAVYYWEYQGLRFVESEGFNVAYITNDDVYSNPDQLLDHKAVLTLGHDEYWTGTERDAYEQARDKGVNLSFVSSNTAYWQVRYQDDTRTMVGYKESVENDPKSGTQEETDKFRNLPNPRPECELMGVQYEPPITSNTASHFPTYTVTDAADDISWFNGSSLAPGDELEEIVGYELDHIVEGCDVPGELTTLFTFNGNSPYLAPGGEGAQAVTYTAPSDAVVFSSGSMNFAWALSDVGSPWNNPNPSHPGIQRFMINHLNDMIDSN